MSKKKKVLVLGGTGAMGIYLVPELISKGYSVDVTTRTIRKSSSGVQYIIGDAMDESFIQLLVKEHYDAIIDFMIYPSSVIDSRASLLISNTDQYIFLSSYRVYGNQQLPITESAPQLVDIIKDNAFLKSDDYSLRKSHGEQVLRNSGRDNWTIIRPAITYSKYRFQLITLEARNFIARALAGKKVLVPKEALDIQATMTWAGDVAKMIVGLIGKPEALRNCFTVSTSEHHTWGEIAEYYHQIIGLQIDPVDKETFLNVIESEPANFSSRWQLDYDRMYNRIIDNSKILSTTGLKQNDFIPLFEGLKKELSSINNDNLYLLSGSSEQSKYMDLYYSK